MTDDHDAELIEHLVHCGLDGTTARKAVAEIIAYYGETTEGFVRRRHAELQVREGLTNRAIYPQLLAEIECRRFASPVLTERQLRRMIYG